MRTEMPNTAKAHKLAPTVMSHADTLISLCQLYKYVKLIYSLKFRMNPLCIYSA